MDEDLFEKLELNETETPYSIRHRCYYFSKQIIQLVAEVEYEKVYSSIFHQLVRSATSIGANLVEGRAGSSKRDWTNYFAIALKSANETKYWLCLIRDTMKVSRDRLEPLVKEADEISKIIASILIKSRK